MAFQSAAFFILLLAPSLALPPTPCDGLIRVGPTGAYLDTCNRTRFFHGLNSVAKSPPYIPNISPDDATLWASLGMNVVRLGVMWAGAAPTARGSYNTTYLSALASLSQSLYTTQSMYTFLDAHQDGFSEYFCDDGAPRWAASEYSQGAPGFPLPLAPSINNNCSALSGSIPWAELYFTNAVGQAFQTLYTTKMGQDDFAGFWGAAVTAYSSVTGVLGWELLNEPWAGDVLADPLRILPSVADAVNLQPFYMNVSVAIRAAEAAAGVAPRIIFSEPVTYDNFFPAGFSEIPGGEGGRGLSYHYYSLPDISGYRSNILTRASDAQRLGAGGILSEFDIDLASPVVSPYTALDMRGTLDVVDMVGHSWIGWDFSSIKLGNGTLHVPTIRELARPYPLAVAGHNATFAFSVGGGGVAGSGNFTLSYTMDPQTVGGLTEIFVSTGLWWEVGGLSVAVVPVGVATWEWEHIEGAVILPDSPITSIPPTPFAHSFLRLGPAANSSATSPTLVTVTITSNAL